MRPADPRVVGDLERILSPDRVLSRPIDRLGRSADASIYRLVPEAIVRPRGTGEVREILAWASRRGRHVTFRAAGTSLSGQSVSDDVLVDIGAFFRSARVLDDGARIWTQPGVVGAHLNRLLAAHRTRIGPDPASIDAAMVGGILANNSSGMCCGVAQNSYHTLDSLSVLLADGTLVDTAEPAADEALRRARPDLHAELRAMRDEIRRDEPLASRIRKKFSTKNTSGYSLNAFVDHDRPVDILAHLMVGSEGTLGFVADATFRTVPEPPARATALAFFAELEEAGAAVAPLTAAGADALEILDAASLRSISTEHPFPFEIARRHAALLVELRRADESALAASVADAQAILRRHRLLEPPRFTTGEAERAALWHLRKGLAARTGAMRPTGTAFLTEDVAVPVERLAEAVLDFQALFERHGIPDTVIFGHAKDGNLHFVLAEDVRSPEAIERYGQFIQSLVDLVVHKYDGAIKAEHGSGRNMAPFVKTEWGERAYSVMERVKRMLDPGGILNPGVLLNPNPRAHVEDLKPCPTISPLADRCTECGFCEPRCPSRDLTLTPRQRIVVTRELTRLGASASPADREWAEALEADFAYEGVTTCAGDSMCQAACPVKIDTGALVKELKAAAHPAWSHRAAGAVAESFSLVAAAARGGMGLVAAARALPFGSGLVALASGAAHAALPTLVPRVPADLALPRPAPRLEVSAGVAPAAAGRVVVYFPSCLTRIVGALPGEDAVPVARAMDEVLRWAGFSVRLPEGLSGLCCGMAFASKGYPDAARAAARKTAEALWRASSGGRLPVVTDASPCAGTLSDLVASLLKESGREVRMLDFPSFWAREVLPGVVDPPRRKGTAILHPTCTLIKSGGVADLMTLARAHAEAVEVPLFAECCGFAGDRGFLVPELTESATAVEAAEVRRLLEREPGAGCYSTCRTCEIGMSRAVGRPFRSVLHLVHEAVARA
ncbi:MAG TPA: FAD-binding and (Fe-S)-binding domain-containing protein [Vicinamibacteria bacterium]|nr:FAD-binding and (Fe-S)-binding domain-containing protein [Vicinamibacteria bacterium]